MTSPHVTELPRKLEPSDHDTFAGGVVIEFAPAAARADNVVRLRVPDGPPAPDAPLSAA